MSSSKESMPFVVDDKVVWSPHAEEFNGWLVRSVGFGLFTVKSVSKTPEGYDTGHNVEINAAYGKYHPCPIIQSDEMFEHFDPTMLA